MEYSTILLWFSLVWACFHFLTCARFTSKLPPGPFPLPVLGNLLELGKKPHHSLAELAKSYGPLMTIKLGSVTTIVVSSANMAKEVLQKHDQALSARTIPDSMRVFNHNEASVVWLSSTPLWRNLRKIFATQLVSTQRLNDSERIRLSKVKDLMDHIRDSSRSRRVINIGQIVFSTTLNVISNTMFSMDLAHLDSDTAREFKAVVWGVMEVIGRPNLANYFPLLRPLDPQGVRRCTSIYFGKLYKLFDTIIDERLQSKEEGGANDLLATLLQHTEENGFKLTHVEIRALLVVCIVSSSIFIANCYFP
ncbi:hypothetical protein IFM89_020859 [Coptis chinensis]|uniref:Cytochrome P450 n=1 Tax=Coptis chinensis TaxID=261450 RepID=A0A835J177_9MAGN|nr:hypothetical protein IFM89_020859 [Coptis chinensis]